MFKKVVLIPAYEPDDKLICLVKKLNKKNVDIVIVDDGSEKQYDDIFKSLEEYAVVLKYKVNMGKGYALKYGINYIDKSIKGNYVVCTMDADGQHDVKDAFKLFDYCIDNPTELVLGMRLRDQKVPFRSRLGNGITRYIFKKISKSDIYDTQTGLRCFSNVLVPYLLSINGNRYEYEMNVLLNLKKNNIQFHEIKIQTIYIDNNESSHFNTIFDSYRIYKDILKFAVRSNHE